MTRTPVAAPARLPLAAALLAAGMIAGLGGSVPGDRGPDRRPNATPVAGSLPPAGLRAFPDCSALAAGLRAAALAAADQFEANPGAAEPDRAIAAEGGAAKAGPAPNAAPPVGQGGPGGQSGAYSGTNVHEAGVDEPDLIKTDGRRILAVTRGVLRVVDAGNRTVIGSLDLAAATGQPDRISMVGQPGLLLAGDRVLILADFRSSPAAVDDRRLASGPLLVLVDLKGRPSVIATFTTNGSILDARQRGSVVRVVVRSGPLFANPRSLGTGLKPAAALDPVIRSAEAEDWLPRYRSTSAGRTDTGQVPCSAVLAPTSYSATSLLTVLTFDLAADRLGDGRPVSIVADGELVYGTSSTLTIANDQRWRAGAAAATELYQFSTAGSGRPSLAASGRVPGWLLNQYSMSEWNGHLRVATTSTTTPVPDPAAAEDPGSGPAPRIRQPSTESAVYVLGRVGDRLEITGQVGGLGNGERIFAVRFIGPVGYVVTFRQTDPLYVVDLRDPAAPVTRGALELTGYSGYLHPTADGRLIGVGQEADGQGRRLGTLISLFDVTDPAAPRRTGRYHLPGSRSPVESEPHAFCYWAPTGTVVVPILPNSTARAITDGSGGRWAGAAGALVLAINADRLDRVGMVQHPAAVDGTGLDPAAATAPIQRALVIGRTLWTYSLVGLRASDLTTLADQAWLRW